MKQFRADLHIHTTLSPCGDLEMSPVNIVNKALEMNLDIIGITDHNSTRQCQIVRRYGEKMGLTVIMGAEVTTKEEVHCLAFFENEDQLLDFQNFLDLGLPDIQNDPTRFGFQVAVDENELITYTEQRLLISALIYSLNEIEEKVHSLNGIFIPAHADKSRFSILGQLGFVPPDIRLDALEISPFTDPVTFHKQHQELIHYPLISGSDAHYLAQIGTKVTLFNLKQPSFSEMKTAIRENNAVNIKVLN